MPAALGFAYFYHRLTGPLSEDGRDEVDAILGFGDAVARVNEQELALIRASGGGIG